MRNYRKPSCSVVINSYNKLIAISYSRVLIVDSNLEFRDEILRAKKLYFLAERSQSIKVSIFS